MKGKPRVKTRVTVNVLTIRKSSWAEKLQAVFGTHRSRGAPWPPGQSVSVDGHNAAAYPANPELRGSPSADSPAGQSAPSAFAFACGFFK